MFREIEGIDISLTSIALILLLLFGTSIALALLSAHYRLFSTGIVKTVGVNIIDAKGNPITHINWGTLFPNSTSTYQVFACNNGTVPITLNMITENWNPPSAQQYLTLSWNYSGIVINPNQTLPITFSLYVSENVSGISDFSFDIVIIGEEMS